MKGFRTIVIKISERDPFALWCDGEAPVDGDDANVGSCFFLDSDGYIFANAPYFQDNVYFKLYGKPFLKNIEIAEEVESESFKTESIGSVGIESGVDENEALSKVEETSISNEAVDISNAEYIGIYFLPPAEFTRIMQLVSLLEKINLQSYALVVTSPDLYELSLVSGGTLRFLPGQDFHQVIDDLEIAYIKKFSNESKNGPSGRSDISPEDIEYIDIRFDNKILFKFKEY